MKKMSSTKLSPAKGVALVAGFFLVACDTPEPEDPRQFIPGPQEYYNEALQFSLRYPQPLNIDVEDRSSLNEPGVSLKLQYPGNDYTVFTLSTYDPSMLGHIRLYLIPGSETPRPVDGETGSQFEVEDQSDDADGPIRHVVVERFDRLYVFTGKGETFDEVLDSFRFIEPRPVAVEGGSGG